MVFNGWVAGDSGTILYTSDGGTNWKRQTTNYTTPLLSISFCDESNGWAVGDNGIILKTTNQGNDWSRVYNDTSINIRNFKVECISPTTTIVLRDSNTGDFHQETKIWETTDNGESWKDISPYENGFSFLRDFSFTSSEYGWICGNGGNIDGYQIHRTTNSGTSWNTKYFNFPTLWSMQKIFFKNSLEGWATDWDTLYYTSDGGEIWNVSGVPNFNDLTDIVMFGNIGYASRLIGKIEKTTDFGNSWVEQSTAPANFVTDIEFINENIGWAVGWNGMIYKTINGGVTSVGEDNQITKSFTLYQNYPNPFNPSTTITYSIPKESFVKLTIFNSIGQLVKTIVNENQYSGNYKINFNADGLTSGVYYYQLISANKIITKKFMLLK
ncbi:MAG: YCF48-related protein [Ignavibacteriaceae bacterium]